MKSPDSAAQAYEEFIAGKSAHAATSSIPAAGELNQALFPFQRDLVTWALRRGRAALFADTGLGKTLMQLEWSKHASAHGRVLILAPLAVAEQTVAEGKRFGIEVKYLRKDDGVTPIVIANYEMLSHFEASNFVAVVIDESSILKAFDGKTRNAVIESFAATPWRLACTATPAPNDHTELGNHSEFLGVKSRVEMLSEYFVHDGGETSVWRLKGHARAAFWRWLSTWAAVVRRPSDLGHSDEGYILPELRMHERVLDIDHADARKVGLLFAPEVRTLNDQRATRRMTMDARVAIAAELAAGNQSTLIWCELNDESKAITKAIPGAVEVCGSDTHEEKAARMLGFASGAYRVLVSKSSLCGFGMNFQICSRQIFVGVSHSYEQTYQAIRRSWRFGQKRPVDVFVIRATTETAIVANLKRKEADADRMAESMASCMRDVQREGISSAKREYDQYQPKVKMETPTWLQSETDY